jgi:hypothetical protein
MTRHVGAALRQRPDGRYVPTASDRLTRPVHVLTTEGVKPLTLRGSRVATLVAKHWNAVHRFLSTGDTAALAPFHHTRVAGHVLETNPDAIERQARHGELEFEDLYQS